MNYRHIIQKSIAVLLCIAMLLPFAGCSSKAQEKMQILVPEDFVITAENLRCEDGIQFIDSQILLVAKEGTKYKTVENLAKKANGEIIGYISFSRDFHINFPDGKTYDELTSLLEQWRSEDFIQSASLHRVYSMDTQSVDYTNDPWLNTTTNFKNDVWCQPVPSGNNWWAEVIGMPSVWAMSVWDNLDTTVKVGVIDKCFNTNHQDLDGVFAMAPWYNTPSGSLNHGNHVAGLIAAEMGNSVGIAGVAACANPQLYGFAQNGFSNIPCSTDIMLKYAFALMFEQGVKLINLSMGLDSLLFSAANGNANAISDLEFISSSLEQFLKDALNAGYDFLIVKSAGNTSGLEWIQCQVTDDTPYGYRLFNGKTDPKELALTKNCSTKYDILGAIDDETVRSHIIFVGASSFNPASFSLGGTGNTHAFLSNHDCDIYAPGENILSLAQADPETVCLDGTSMAAPIVTGVAALVWSVNPALSASQVKSIILKSVSEPIQPFEVPLVHAFSAVMLASMTKGTADADAEVSSEAVLTGYVYETNPEDGLSDYPIADAEITVSSADGQYEKTIVSSEQGGFDLRLPAGEYSVTAEMDGYTSSTRVVTLGEREARFIPFRLNPLSLVSDAYHSHAPSYEFGGGIHFYIPRVNLPQDMAEEVNSTIFDNLICHVRSDSSYDMGMNYLWAAKDDIISILVLTGEDTNTALSQFYVYNVSAETGESLPNSALWEAFGISESQYYNQLEAILDEYYASLHLESFPESYLEYVNRQIDRSYSTENLISARPYVDENGDLCVMMKIYSLAGPEYHYFLYNLTGANSPKRPEYNLHEEACLTIDDPGKPYELFVNNGCYNWYLDDGEKAEGYAILDINGDGIDELIIDTGWSSQEFHDHLIFSINEYGQVSHICTIYSYLCLSYSEEQCAVGYFYPRHSMQSIFHCSTLYDYAMYESHTLYGDHSKESYSVFEYDSEGNELAAAQDAKDLYDTIFSTFHGISWSPMP